MYVYKCNLCKTIFKSLMSLKNSKCSLCGGRLVFLEKELQVNKTEKFQQKENYKFLVNLAKLIFTIWGIGGTANVMGKAIEREKISRRDVFHTLFPLVTAGTIHAFQHPQDTKKLLFPSQQNTKMSDNLGKIRTSDGEIDWEEVSEKSTQLIIRAQQLGEDKSEISGIKQVGAASLSLKDIITKLKDMTNQIDKKAHDDPRALQWKRILSELPRILILGAQGMGKSCLAFWLVEILRERCLCFVYRLPEEGIALIPPWLGVIQDLNDAPSGSLILIDETYLILFSRESQTRKNRDIIKILNLARQKRLAFIFVAHEARHIDKNVLSCIDTLIMKKSAPLQVDLDRSFLKKYLLKAQSVFQGKSDASSKSISYICFSPSGFEGILENLKPSFWSEKLSHIFASGSIGKVEKPAHKLTPEEKKERARKLRNVYGYPYGEIAKELGVGKTTAYRWLNEDKNIGTKR